MHLLIHELQGQKVVEAYHLALYLKYAQQHLLRKQVLTDWKEHFAAGEDYLLVTDKTLLRTYEIKAKVNHIRPERGRIFFTQTGLRKLLKFTFKDTKRLERDLAEAGFKVDASEEGAGNSGTPAGFGSPADVAAKEEISLVTTPAPETKGLQERQWEYQILERLLEHLKELATPALQGLAITSAEAGLGWKLEGLREQISPARGPTPPTEDGEDLFEGRPQEDTMVSFTQIGARAGGYTSHAAGAAANIVAKRRGYSPDEIRTVSLGFNWVYMGKDAQGHPRHLVRFDHAFANEVIAELRSNPAFTPSPPKVIVESGFEASKKRLPNLNQEIFPTEEDLPS